MHIDILTIIPELLKSPFNHSIIKRAVDKGVVEIEVHDIRDFATGKHKQVDDYAYGGGAGMVMMIEPIVKAIEYLQAQRTYDEIIYMTPDGKPYNQSMANGLSLLKNIIILCGHYKGIDHRLRECIITKEISVGDYVLTGGELAAAIVTDSIVRLLPGAMSDETSALEDSFQDNLLAPPVYSRPRNYKGREVPEVLLSGNFKEIDDWRFEQSVKRTRRLRPDLLGENEEKND